MTDRPQDKRLRLGLAALLSSAIIGIIFWGLFQIDLPFARFLRSLHMGWLERIGDMGTRIGSGAGLIAISLGLLGTGLVWKRADIRRAGFTTLLAHGVAAIAVQAMKHGIGRPRPRLMHAENGFPWRPSLESGLDSFPSGHTTASFAVATVVAKSFPRLAWPVYGIAAFVALSRAIRGSHFPTDVVAGVGVGMLVGIIFSHPIREWKQSLLDLIARLLPTMVVIFSVLWLITGAPNSLAADVMMAVGIGAMVMGVALRVRRQLVSSLMTAASDVNPANVLIVVGLALTTGSWLVATVAGMLCAIRWLISPEREGIFLVRANGTISSYRAVLTEIPLMVGLALAVLTIQHARGLLPIL